MVTRGWNLLARTSAFPYHPLGTLQGGDVQVPLGLLIASGLLVVIQRAPRPVRWEFVTPAPLSALPGVPMRVDLRARIEWGWHLYSLTQPPGGPRPTRIALLDSSIFVLDSAVVVPPPDSIPDQSFGIMTEVYDDSVTFTLPLKMRQGAKIGVHLLRAAVTFQTCTGRICLPLRTDTVSTPIRVTARSKPRSAPRAL